MALLRIVLLCLTVITTALKNNLTWTTSRFTVRDTALSTTMDDELRTLENQRSGATEGILPAKINLLEDPLGRMQGNQQRYVDERSEQRILIGEFLIAFEASKTTDAIEFGYRYFENLRRQTGTNSIYPLVLAGPSGVGKGTLVNLLMKRYPHLFGFSVSHTTRKPREGEVDGVHYHFVDMAEMESAVERGEFLEHARVHTNMYGTSAKSVREVQSQGKICILDIDIQGVEKVKSSKLPCKYVFIAPPSMEVLENRLRNRGTESEESILIRLATASEELQYGVTEGNFDAVIVNNDIETAVADVIQHLKKSYPSFDFDIETSVSH